MQKAIITTLLIAGAVLSFASTTDKEKKKKAKEVASASTDVRISAPQLAAEYKANEVAADGKYKGKIIEVSGVVDSVGKDVLDQPYVSLSGGRGNFMGVQCYFGKHNLSELSGLKKGQSVTLKCKGAGKTISPSLKFCSVK